MVIYPLLKGTSITLTLIHKWSAKSDQGYFGV